MTDIATFKNTAIVLTYSHVLNVAKICISGCQPGSYSRTFQTRPKVMVLGRVQNVAQGEYCSRV